MATAGTATGAESTSAAPSRPRQVTELGVAYGLILAVIWTPRPLQKMLWWVAVAVLAFLIAKSWQGAGAAGLRAGNLLRSMWVVGAALVFAGAAVALSTYLHTMRNTGNAWQILSDYWVYIVWSGVQQFLLQCFFLFRLLRLLPKPRQAAFAAAGMFALAHLPNPLLAGLTIVWGTLACLIFLRYRNLYPLALAHAILGVTIAVAVPGPVDHNMRVGLGYLKYHPRAHQRPPLDRFGASATSIRPFREILNCRGIEERSCGDAIGMHPRNR